MKQPNRDRSLAEKAGNAGSEKLDALPEWWYYLTTDQSTDHREAKHQSKWKKYLQIRHPSFAATW